jgi:translation initiation factor eIF-2B subunit beta
MEMPASYHAERPELKQEVMEAIGEINSDLEDMHKNIDEQATKHIHADEVILTYGRSKTVEMV